MRPSRASQYVVVKEKGGALLDRLVHVINRIVSPPTQRRIARGYHVTTVWLGSLLGTAVLFLVCVDAVANNWALNDFIGNALQFRTPVAPMQSLADLPAYYSFATGFAPSNLSLVGYWMIDTAVQEIASDSSDIYLLTAGTYHVTGPDMDFCNGFARTFTVDLTRPVKLAFVEDSITFLLGDAISHAFTDDLVAKQAPNTSTIKSLTDMGYRGTRMQTKLQMTTTIPIKNSSATQLILATYYRVYSKAYCTGCNPMAEVNRGTCNLTLTYTDATRRVKVSVSKMVLGAEHDVGLMFHRDVYSTIAAVIKYIAIFIASAGFLASRKTVQWREEDATKVETLWHKLVDMIAPKYFPHLSHTLRFDLFCYNSDLFVLLFVVSNILDMNSAFMFIREVHVINQYDVHFTMSLQLFALSTRLLWFNLGMLKLAKLFVHVISPAAYCGDSVVMPLLNLSSVTALYLSAILLFYVPEYVEYNNSLRADIKSRAEQLDGVFVDFFNSFYVRGMPAIVIGLVLNMVGVLAFDHVTMWAFWRRLQKNSLSRQAMYNSTSVLCDFVSDVHEVDNDEPTTDASHRRTTTDKSVVMQCKARRLSTLQWYFMSHMVCFGLPERELSKKKSAAAAATTAAAKDDNATGDGKTILYVVGQSESGHLHLLDDHLVDVKSLAFNIKILRDTAVEIK
ncbi:Aste57867_18546 [Aphanomyces stellatus]|uniref:Aste57867_18546 protein n=1 Tax=Aphanomyces stellatus TaxID=120398 RepID=A0A485LC77_9STRA|nr:hypothetical protein As57867_018484 [Aphanomyces stellatus]VFT95282.1 Aste57867_18546 [Aphanomyces stellatus]